MLAHLRGMKQPETLHPSTSGTMSELSIANVNLEITDLNSSGNKNSKASELDKQLAEDVNPKWNDLVLDERSSQKVKQQDESDKNLNCAVLIPKSTFDELAKGNACIMGEYVWEKVIMKTELPSIHVGESQVQRPTNTQFNVGRNSDLFFV